MGFFTASRLKKMKANFKAHNLAKATAYADKIKPEDVHTAYDLSMMADIYVEGKHYGAAKRVYTEMFRRNKSVRVCKSLIDISLKANNVKQAISYVRELKNLDEEDYERYIYQYKIGKKIGKPDEYLIACLLKVKEADYVDIWALELAKLYYKIGDYEECIKECKNIKLWFPETDVCDKANILLDACAQGTTYADAVGVSHVKTAPAPEKKEEAEEEEYEEEYTEEEYTEEDTYEEEDEEASEEEYFEEDALASAIQDIVDEESAEETEEADEETEEETEETFDSEDSYEEEEVEEFEEEEDFEEAEFDNIAMKELSADDDEEYSFASEEEEEDTFEEEEEETSELSTDTIINDSLSQEVLKALHDEEELAGFDEDDEIDETILRMLNEEEEN